MIRIRTLWILAVSETRAERHPPAYHPDPSSVHYLVVYRSKYMVTIGLYSMTSMLKRTRTATPLAFTYRIRTQPIALSG